MRENQFQKPPLETAHKSAKLGDVSIIDYINAPEMPDAELVKHRGAPTAALEENESPVFSSNPAETVPAAAGKGVSFGEILTACIVIAVLAAIAAVSYQRITAGTRLVKMQLEQLENEREQLRRDQTNEDWERQKQNYEALLKLNNEHLLKVIGKEPTVDGQPDGFRRSELITLQNISKNEIVSLKKQLGVLLTRNSSIYIVPVTAGTAPLIVTGTDEEIAEIKQILQTIGVLAR